LKHLRAQAVSLEEKLLQAEREKDEVAQQNQQQTVTESVAVPAGGLDADQIKDVVRAAVEEANSDSAPSSESQIDDLKASIDALASKVTHGHGSSTNKAVEAPSEEALVELFSRGDDEDVENNLDQVEVKNAKAGGISANLAKLKNLQKETE